MEMNLAKVISFIFGFQLLLFILPVFNAEKIGDTKVVHEWVSLEFMWPSPATRDTYVRTGKYIPENCILSGLGVFKNQIYVTVPRLRNGVPSSLNILKTQNNKTLLKPYPNLAKNMESADKCENFQFVSNIAIDSRTGWMWIIDTGRVNLLPFDGSSPINMCPAKLVIYNLRNNSQIHSHIFSEKVVSKTFNYLSNIVIDGNMAYISDTFDNKLIVYNYDTDTSFSIKDSTMIPDPSISSFNVGGIVMNWHRGINSIALSSDFQTLYYSPFSSFNLYSIPTSVLKQNVSAFKSQVKYLGNMTSATDGMLCSQKRLYVSLLSQDAIYYWDINKDTKIKNGKKMEKMETFRVLAKDSETMQWPDSMAVDEYYLWFTTNRMQKFFTLMDFTGKSGFNFRILKTYIGKQRLHGDAVRNTFCQMTLLVFSFCATIFARFH